MLIQLAMCILVVLEDKLGTEFEEFIVQQLLDYKTLNLICNISVEK